MKSEPTSVTPQLDLSEFPKSSPDAWRALAEAELKGADFEKRLIVKTAEGITIRPLYTEEDAGQKLPDNTAPPSGSVKQEEATAQFSGPWGIAQEVRYPTPAEFNRAALNDLAAGAGCITLQLDAAGRAAIDPDMASPDKVGLGGTSIATVEDVGRAFESIDLRKNPLFVRTGGSALPFAALLFAWLKKTGKKPSDLTGCIEMDPLGVLSHEGSLPLTLQNSYVEMAELTKWAVENAPHLRTICVHARCWHEAGGSAVQELAFALAAATEYLRAMQKQGLDVDVVAPRMRFTFAIGSDFFMEIAKLRAMRRLWVGVVTAFGGNEHSCHLDLHGHTSQYNKTISDPYVNLLRTATEAFSGALGGCSTLAVSPFDEVIRQPDEISRRLARNIQILLQKESHIGEVVDPIAGSYYAESLTEELAQKAWELFQKVEAEGGLAASLKEGTVQQITAKVADERHKDIAKRIKSLVGTNVYANPEEKPLEPRALDHAALHALRAKQVADYRTGSETEHDTRVLDRLSSLLGATTNGAVDAAIDAAFAGATLGEIARALPWRGREHTVGVPVCTHRAARSFELLRKAADNYRQANGAPPVAYLAQLGPLKEHRARADFSAGFFSPGGFRIQRSEPLEEVESASKAILNANAEVVIFCSSDKLYPEMIPGIAEAVAKSDAILVVAGRPGEHETAWRKAGIQHFIYLGADVVSTLKAILIQLGISL